MAGRRKATDRSLSNGATVGYEAELWRMADALRGSMDAAEYKHGPCSTIPACSTGLFIDMEERLRHKVDVVTERSRCWLLRCPIPSEACLL